MTALGLNFARIVHQMKASRKFLSDTHVKVMSHGGFPYEAFNGKAQINPWSIMHMMEFSRNASFNKFSPTDHCFLEFDKLYQNYLVFIASATTKVYPKLYDYSVTKGPLEIHVELDNVGKTSFGLKTSIFQEATDTPLCESFVQSVFVDLAKRKPNPPPDWWLEKYKQGLEGQATLRVPRHVLPQDGILWNYQMKVAASEIDTYWHTNWSQYVKFMFNAYVDFSAGTHSSGNLAAAFQKSKEFSVLYMQESNLGDSLDVQLWRDKHNPNLFKFQFLKQADVICESQLELYPHDPSEDVHGFAL
ncbi:hypothetical protein EGW08_002169 [Elysia chlorotica]|uniref:Uncharacterized protein n=1 Tax=Elysia chlorotica TaxID=188477 RepID=A0A3S1CDX3_ELYCH|nr:hypothetical protein EGW08_002169 [Elysia chlorotica]